ncbi:MAG: type 4a pilus biogenesis protein PilO [Spirochaetes bacterium]|nr:type 4a pilus biogenesis protein PilO [Spirochaetota bacterium]
MKNLLFKTIFILVVFILFLLTIISFSKNTFSLIKAKNSYLSDLYYLNNLPEFKERLKTIELEFQNDKKKLFLNLSSISLLNHCSRIADKLNISILSFNPVINSKSHNNDFKQTIIELNIETDYINLIKFINKVESLEFITKIDKLEIYRIDPYSSKIKSKITIAGISINEK